MTTQSAKLDQAALETYGETFRRDGAICIPGLLDDRAMQLVEEVFAYAVEHPGPNALPKPTSEPFVYLDPGNEDNWRSEPYRQLLGVPELGRVCEALFGDPNIWLVNEQITWKKGGSKRTPFHQDTRYFNYGGEDQVQFWISLGSLDKANSLEFVRGSHLGPVYGHIEDPETRLGEKPPMPVDASKSVLESIEDNRDQFDIISWPVERGDVLMFHPNTIHGGAPDRPDLNRRSLTLRFCGPNTVRTPSVIGMAQGIGDFGIFAAIEELPLGAPINTVAQAVRVWPAEAA